MAKRKTKEERRKEVLEVALRLFYKQGYDRTSITDLAQALNLEKATLYHYIKSKEELLYELLRNFLESLRAALSKEYEDKKKLVKLPLLLTDQMKLFFQHQKEAFLYFRERRSLSGKYRKEIEELEEAYLEELTSHLKEGFRSSFQTPRHLALAFLGLISMLVDRLHPQDLEKEKVAKDWVEFFLSGKLKR